MQLHDVCAALVNEIIQHGGQRHELPDRLGRSYIPLTDEAWSGSG
jgi:hypothetical protein